MCVRTCLHTHTHMNTKWQNMEVVCMCICWICVHEYIHTNSHIGQHMEVVMNIQLKKMQVRKALRYKTGWGNTWHGMDLHKTWTCTIFFYSSYGVRLDLCNCISVWKKLYLCMCMCHGMYVCLYIMICMYVCSHLCLYHVLLCVWDMLMCVCMRHA